MTDARQPPDRDEAVQAEQGRLDRATRWAAGAFLASIAASLGLVVLYVVGGATQVEGFLWFLAFGGVAVALTIWVKVLIDEPDVLEEREPMVSDPAARREFATAFESATAEPDPRTADRRRFLARLLAGVAGSVGLALVLPFRSLGPGPGRELFHTDWREGMRLVTEAGKPVVPDDLKVGSVVTVFPEGHVGSAQSQALLIRVETERLAMPEASAPTVEGLVCYSKICTHAACPVGLYRAAVAELLCPCHQSKFKVTEGARPISGPTTRALPQLPLGRNDAGELIALGDFDAPVGPGFWDMGRRE